MGDVSFDFSNKWRIKAGRTLNNYKYSHGKNITTINPNDYYNFKDDPPLYDSQEEIRRFDIYKVDCSNVILVDLRNTSTGTAMEVQHAFDKGIPVVGWYTDEEHGFIHPWIECCCMKKMDGLDNACEYIANYLA